MAVSWDCFDMISKAIPSDRFNKTFLLKISKENWMMFISKIISRFIMNKVIHTDICVVYEEIHVTCLVRVLHEVRDERELYIRPPAVYTRGDELNRKIITRCIENSTTCSMVIKK